MAAANPPQQSGSPTGTTGTSDTEPCGSPDAETASDDYLHLVAPSGTPRQNAPGHSPGVSTSSTEQQVSDSPPSTGRENLG